MNLREAKKLLKKNGYLVIEAYDSVVGKTVINDRKQFSQSYFTKLMKRLKISLATRGVESKLDDSGNSLRINSFEVTAAIKNKPASEGDYDSVKDYDVTLGIYAISDWGEDDDEFWLDDGELIAVNTFNVHNIPGMVQWILGKIQ